MAIVEIPAVFLLVGTNLVLPACPPWVEVAYYILVAATFFWGYAEA